MKEAIVLRWQSFLAFGIMEICLALPEMFFLYRIFIFLSCQCDLENSLLLMSSQSLLKYMHESSIAAQSNFSLVFT